jgi:hypothetical protein
MSKFSGKIGLWSCLEIGFARHTDGGQVLALYWVCFGILLALIGFELALIGFDWL